MSPDERREEMIKMEESCQTYIKQIEENDMKNSKISELVDKLSETLEELSLTNKLIYDAKLEWEHTFDAIPYLIVITDLDGRIMRANQAVKELFNIRYKDFLGRTVDDFFGFGQVSSTECPRKKCIIEKERSSSILYCETLKAHYKFTCSLLYDADGIAYATVLIADNVETQLSEINRCSIHITKFKELAETLDETTKNKILEILGDI
jgi:transcriptional regulator with PAS, ATPase and Fis domain